MVEKALGCVQDATLKFEVLAEKTRRSALDASDGEVKENRGTLHDTFNTFHNLTRSNDDDDDDDDDDE